MTEKLGYAGTNPDKMPTSADHPTLHQGSIPSPRLSVIWAPS